MHIDQLKECTIMVRSRQLVNLLQNHRDESRVLHSIIHDHVVIPVLSVSLVPSALPVSSRSQAS